MNNNQDPPKSSADPADCHTVTEAEIDAALEGSFPASDPIPWTLGTPSCPEPERDSEPSPEHQEE